MKVGALPFSDTVGSGEGAPHPCGHLACTKLTFVVKLLRLLVLANRTHLLRISPRPPEWPYESFLLTFKGLCVRVKEALAGKNVDWMPNLGLAGMASQ